MILNKSVKIFYLVTSVSLYISEVFVMASLNNSSKYSSLQINH